MENDDSPEQKVSTDSDDSQIGNSTQGAYVDVTIDPETTTHDVVNQPQGIGQGLDSPSDGSGNSRQVPEEKLEDKMPQPQKEGGSGLMGTPQAETYMGQGANNLDTPFVSSPKESEKQPDPNLTIGAETTTQDVVNDPQQVDTLISTDRSDTAQLDTPGVKEEINTKTEQSEATDENAPSTAIAPAKSDHQVIEISPETNTRKKVEIQPDPIEIQDSVKPLNAAITEMKPILKNPTKKRKFSVRDKLYTKNEANQKEELAIEFKILGFIASLVVLVIIITVATIPKGGPMGFEACKELRNTKNPVLIFNCQTEKCPFNVDVCAIDCPFGYHSNPATDCPESCECAANGQFQGDIQFNQDELPRMLMDYGYVAPEAELSIFSVGDGETKPVLWGDNIKDDLFYIYYHATSKVTDSKEFKEAVEIFETATCVRFEEKPTGKKLQSVLKFETKSSACRASLGRLPKTNMVNLGKECIDTGIIIHELMHVLGFMHEHTRSDRDQYVQIYEENIKSGSLHQFKKIGNKAWVNLETAYDVDSIMHVSSKAFSKDGNVTITKIGDVNGINFDEEGKLKPTSLIIEKKHTLSKLDIEEINTLYPCLSKGGKIVEGSVSLENRGRTRLKNKGGKHKPTHKWGFWGPWSKCSCSSGVDKPIRSRKRKCKSKSGYGCGKQSLSREEKECKYELSCNPKTQRILMAGRRVIEPTAEHPVSYFEEWGHWGPCVAGGCGKKSVQSRYRSCVMVNSRPSTFCSGEKISIQDCVQQCSATGEKLKGVWKDWSEWNQCFSCDKQGNGVQKRLRQCSPPSLPCDGKQSETKSCRDPSCAPKPPMPLSEWSNWGPCIGRCGKKTLASRRRYCEAKKGETCLPGEKLELQSCTVFCDENGKTTRYAVTPTIVPTTVKPAGYRPPEAASGSGTEEDPWYTAWTSWGDCVGRCGGSAVMMRTSRCLKNNGVPSLCIDINKAKECQKVCTSSQGYTQRTPYQTTPRQYTTTPWRPFVNSPPGTTRATLPPTRRTTSTFRTPPTFAPYRTPQPTVGVTPWGGNTPTTTPGVEGVIENGWSTWSEYSPCPVTCGMLKSIKCQRHRVCIKDGKRQTSGASCGSPVVFTENKLCYSNYPCPGDPPVQGNPTLVGSSGITPGVGLFCGSTDQNTGKTPWSEKDETVEKEESKITPNVPLFSSQPLRGMKGVCVGLKGSSIFVTGWVFGDFNGDNRMDILCTNFWIFYVAQANSMGAISELNWEGKGQKCYSYNMFVGDFNGDNSDDFLCRDGFTKDVNIYLSTNGEFKSDSVYNDDFCQAPLTRIKYPHPQILPLDVNGDGKDDLMCRDGISGEYQLRINKYR